MVIFFSSAASAPKIKPLKSDVVVNEGKKLQLRCESISGSQLTFKWYKDGKELIVSKKSKEIKIKKKKRYEFVMFQGFLSVYEAFRQTWLFLTGYFEHSSRNLNSPCYSLSPVDVVVWRL